MDVPDIMNDVCLPQGRYPENFVLISQLEVCQEEGYLEGDNHPFHFYHGQGHVTDNDHGHGHGYTIDH